ncbi:carbonic anhydrase/acetyltransferase-like protein (isoleucine patch superfamily) [Humitalea rosea]|uniref:Carbonic anhydrase/acetyltransferase-like protein (Isoleucine patch superfamily) n=1 Tax=Humitalea rosea TaxID=990373 RepID=A0A2W7IEQ5_9PROT|nr:gamma carbonic anhydrase family protein [Humitalea rosea]PZW43565.1 carbonic anhydrase/acetyltransferase-like protein (isoleucine patch superfamily) [Humitalea rosea]
MSLGPGLYAFEGKTPSIAATAYIAPTAALIGDVTVGEGSSVWFHCVLRGDTNFIRIGARTNVQDGTIVHVNKGAEPTIIGDDVTIGHAAIIHACTLHDRAFVGMGALVLDRAVIESGGVLAAGSVLPPGKRIGAGELWMGNPAVLVRVLDEAGRARFARNAPSYAELCQRYRCQTG